MNHALSVSPESGELEVIMLKCRQAIAFFLSVLFLLTACACSAKKAAQIDVNSLAEKLKSSIKFDDQLTKLDDKAALKLYSLDSSVTVKQSVYVGTGATAEEISVWQAKDADSAKKVKNAVQGRVDAQKAGFQDYVPAEMTKLKNPVLVTEGNYVILCLSNDNSKAQQIINDALK